KSRDNENGSHFDFLKNQIKNTFANIPKKYAGDIIIAYEPVWAIGAKESMAPEQVYEMNLFVKKAFADLFGSDLAIKTTVLYGGSVTFRNAGDIMKIGQVDGLLVGRESINIAGFVELLKEVDKC
ncbi:MAG: triose-phosphate isomerase, partial [Candidatus Paceibacterota bacterium]